MAGTRVSPPSPWMTTRRLSIPRNSWKTCPKRTENPLRRRSYPGLAMCEPLFIHATGHSIRSHCADICFRCADLCLMTESSMDQVIDITYIVMRIFPKVCPAVQTYASSAIAAADGAQGRETAVPLPAKLALGTPPSLLRLVAKSPLRTVSLVGTGMFSLRCRS